MTSWRDEAPTGTQDDLDGLLDQALGYAEDRLPEGGFAPVAFTVDLDGSVSMSAVGWDEGSEPPPAAALLEGLRNGLRATRDGFRAVAVVLDAALPDGSDVVQVELEHADGQALSVLMPYARGAAGIEPGDLVAAPGRRRTWG